MDLIMLYFSDINYLIIFIILFLLFILSISKRSLIINKGKKGFISKLCVSKNMSTLIKAFSCVMILIGHYAARDVNTNTATIVDKLIYMFTANIALILFMYFSGYGLTLKKYDNIKLKREWIFRLKKIYIPLFFIGIIFVLICYVLPDIYSIDLIKSKELPLLIHEFSNIHSLDLSIFFRSLLGYNDWYVVCIIYFYTIFYLSQYFSKILRCYFTIILGLFLLFYYALAFHFYGWPEAHFFRFPCAFMLGHLIAKHNIKKSTIKENFIDSILLIVFLCTVAIHGKIWLLFYAISILVLMTFALFENYYEVRTKSILFSLGTISYFFYLCHERVGFTLMFYMGLDNVIFWSIITFISSYCIWWLYNKLFD